MVFFTYSLSEASPLRGTCLLAREPQSVDRILEVLTAKMPVGFEHKRAAVIVTEEL